VEEQVRVEEVNEEKKEVGSGNQKVAKTIEV
jgi:hypothetical protein